VATSDVAAPMGPRSVLGIRDYRLVFVAQLISDFGDALTALAGLLLVNSLTGSTAALALMAILLAVPPLTIGIAAGAWVDRRDPRGVMLISDGLRAGLVLGLVVVRTGDLLWLLYLLAFLEASVGTFFAPARISLVSVLVPRQGLMSANSMSQGGRIVAMLLGTAAAGVLVGVFDSAAPAFALDSATFAVSFLLILGIRARRFDHAQGAATQQTSIVRSVRDGIGAIAGSPRLVATMVSTGAVMLGVGAVNILFVPLLINDLNVSPAWFGLIDGSQTLAMILAAALLATRLSGVSAKSIVGVTMVTLAGVVAAVAAVSQVWHVLILLFIVGWAITPLQAAVTTVVQTSTSREMRGRVAGMLNSVTSGASILSMAFAGAFAQVIGVRAVFLLSGLVIAVGAVISVALFRREDDPSPLSGRVVPPPVGNAGPEPMPGTEAIKAATTRTVAMGATPAGSPAWSSGGVR
jgi:MFS transporter, DHA3 family, macrolide efflux protein